MRIVKPETNVNFIGRRHTAAILSVLVIALSIGSLVYHGGPNYGIDFEGGTLIQLKFTEPVAISEVRKAIGGLGMGEFSIQKFGSEEELLVRVRRADTGDPKETTQAEKVETALRAQYGDSFIVDRVEMVGPKVGQDLREKAVLALIYSLGGILIYITFRFEFRFGVAAIIALTHDTIITVGAFSLLDKEFTLTVIAALLTVIGYSLNDTIVVFDRIRENLRLKRGLTLAEMLNVSINQTLSRTILTSGTTLVVVLSIFLFGGEVIHDFSFALLIGVVVGTYSSIFIASPIILIWDTISKRKTHTAKTTVQTQEEKTKRIQSLRRYGLARLAGLRVVTLASLLKSC